jgi:hypothetical protein
LVPSSSSNLQNNRSTQSFQSNSQQRNTQRPPPSISSSSLSSRPFPSNPISKPPRPSATDKTIASAQSRADLQKIEYEKNVDQFLNIYLEEWRRKRKQSLKTFLQEIKFEQKSSSEVEGGIKGGSFEPPGPTRLCSKGQPKTFSRFFSNVSQQLRVIDETCARYSSSSSFERESSPPPAPPPLLHPSPAPHDVHSLLAPLQTPTREFPHQVLERKLFAGDSSPPPPPNAIQTSVGLLRPSHLSLSLDSPTAGESREEKKRLHSTATHFLVPGGLSTQRPALSPLSASASLQL